MLPEMPSRISRSVGLGFFSSRLLAVGEVAAQTGFVTVQHFSRVFNNVVGLSPRKYRQQQAA